MIWLLLTHFVADFIFQRRSVAINKSHSVLALLEHISIIFLCFLPWGFDFAFTNALAHMIIDGCIWNVYKKIRHGKGPKFKYWEDGLFYKTIGFDQFLHVATIVILLEVLK